MNFYNVTYYYITLYSSSITFHWFMITLIDYQDYVQSDLPLLVWRDSSWNRQHNNPRHYQI